MHPALNRLNRALARLPGVGKRSAERMALRLLQDGSGELARELMAAIHEAGTQLCRCKLCGNLTGTDRDPCVVCAHPDRDKTFLCVVEEAWDIELLEQAGGFKGLYFCLQGKLSPGKGQTVTSERLKILVSRIHDHEIKEVLLALNADIESDATVNWLSEQLEPLGVKVSRLALGIPAGSGVSYMDPVTLGRAIEARQSV